MEHGVRLPHPDRTEPTVGKCSCGDWLVVYRWGEHGDAVHAAGQHIEEVTRSEPIEAGEMNGDRMVWPGRSL